MLARGKMLPVYIVMLSFIVEAYICYLVWGATQS